MKQGNTYRRLNVSRHAVHGVGADQQHVRTPRFEASCSIDHSRRQARPITPVL